MFNVRLRLAVFSGPNFSAKYTLLFITAAGAGPVPGPTARYRGPALDQLQPSGMVGTGSNGSVQAWALGVLDVPGLSEGRPALLPGDAVYLRFAADWGREVATVAAAVDGSTVFLLLPKPFWSESLQCTRWLVDAVGAIARGDGTVTPRPTGATTLGGSNSRMQHFDGLVHVRFTFERASLQRMHAALAMAPVSALPCRLLPEAGRRISDDAQALALLPSSTAVSSSAAALPTLGGQPLNAEQRRAVAAVLAGAGRPAPYALFGPPGTGKTCTLVELALQLLHEYPSSRLLLCAPQNYSADLLCSALSAGGVNGGTMVRVCDGRRAPYTAKEDVLPFCCLDSKARVFLTPSNQQLKQARVVVATCAAAGALADESRPLLARRFTHVLIDEAGQAMLPEALIPLGLLSPRGSLDPGWGAVLCGDPRQLGPVVRSAAAAGAGLASSLLEQLIEAHGEEAAELAMHGLEPPTVS
jgi:hypothetical protein